MGVDIKDHRRYVEGKLAIVKDEPTQLLPQVESANASTGDPEFDKLVRTLEALIQRGEEEAKLLAFKAAGAVQADMMKLCQFEFMFVKGKVEGWKEAAQIPAKIIAESKPANA